MYLIDAYITLILKIYLDQTGTFCTPRRQQCSACISSITETLQKIHNAIQWNSVQIVPLWKKLQVIYFLGINWLLPQLSTLYGRYLSALIIDSSLIESRSAMIARSGPSICLSKLSLKFQSQVQRDTGSSGTFSKSKSRSMNVIPCCYLIFPAPRHGRAGRGDHEDGREDDGGLTHG